VDGKEQGEAISYTINGEIEKIENYKDGVLIED
jgi:antitoxin component YwqK of YwqJK toxin-antitoxin module